MKSRLIILLSAVVIFSAPIVCRADNPRVVMNTVFGKIGIELYESQAPNTVDNFLHYVNSGYYNGTVIHRVDNNPTFSIIQGGGYYVEDSNIYYRTPDRGPIENESDNGLSNLRGTIAMARSLGDPNSAKSQFFINQTDNVLFDKENYSDGYGFCVFGKVFCGMEVVDYIADINTVDLGQPLTQFPYPPVVDIYYVIEEPEGFWLRADVNYDGIVDIGDLQVVCSNWLTQGQLGDIEVTGIVDFSEFAQVAESWRRTSVWRRYAAGDINNSLSVDFKDFALFAKDWQKTGMELYGDLDLDGKCGAVDLMYFALDWLREPQ